MHSATRFTLLHWFWTAVLLLGTLFYFSRIERQPQFDDEEVPTLTPSPTPTPTYTPTPTPTHTPTPPFRFAASAWYEVDDGLEYGVYYPPASGGAQIIVIRIDPRLFTFRAHYHAGAPRTRAVWANELPCPRLFINANFFDFRHEVRGLLVADGLRYGRAFARMGGIMQVDMNGAVQVRSTLNVDDVSENLFQAVQGYPMLVQNGSPLFSHTDDDVITRRTVVASDQQGRILWIATPGLGIRLATLSHYLAHTGMEVVNAFNLDGGSSSMLHFVLSNELLLTIDSVYPVPAVLAAYSYEPHESCSIANRRTTQALSHINELRID